MAVMTLARKWLRTQATPAATANLAAWLAANVRTEFVLCEVEPSRTARGFTQLDPLFYTSTYSVAFPRFHQTDVIQGGIYAKVIGVLQNDVALAEVTGGPTVVSGTAGSFCWDEANEMLYVRTTSGADPDTFTLMQVQVRMYFANQPIVLLQTADDPTTAVYYHPWLTADLPRIVRTREDLLFGSMAAPAGNVSFTNGHGAWWTLVAPEGEWNWKYKPIRFYIGGGYSGGMLTRDQFAAMAAMKIEDQAPNEEVCQFKLVPVKRLAEMELPITPFFSSDYAHLGDGVEGTKKWIGYGRTTMRPDLTDTSSHGVYTVADAAFQTLFAVHGAWAIDKTTGVWTALTLTTDYTVNLTACTVTIVNATYAHAGYDIAVDVTGKPDGLGDYFRTYAAIVEDILTTAVGASAADIDAAAFATAAADATNEISFWVKSQRALTSLFATQESGLPSLGRSVMGTVQDTVEGKWTTSIWNPNVDNVTLSLRRSDFAAFAPKPKLRSVFPTVRVFYNFDHARQSWSVVEKDDPTTRYRTESRDRADLYTFLRDETDAQRLAERYQLIAGGVTIEAAFQERAALLATSEAGGKALVTYAPYPSVAGAIENQAMELLEAEVVLAPKLAVSGILGNFHGLAGRVGKWMDSAAPAWADASATERQTSGFWCDSNGLADPLDPASADQSIHF
jgi:hypothetical protein